MKTEAGVIRVCGNNEIFIEHHERVGANTTVIMVNGGLAQKTSFSRLIRNLKEHANIVLFDLPFVGESRKHNIGDRILTKDDEVEILLHLIERFDANYLIGASWGCLSSLLAMARRPPSIEKAVMLGFSPVINDALRDLMINFRLALQCRDFQGGAQLINNTVGEYLRRPMKRLNYRYLQTLIEGNEQQLICHVEEIFELDRNQYVNRLTSIDAPVLFINGALDKYTTPKDVHSVALNIKKSHFEVIENTGHFLYLESEEACRAIDEIERAFLFGSQNSASIDSVSSMVSSQR
jgi:rhamnosyltransferase subunit A